MKNKISLVLIGVFLLAIGMVYVTASNCASQEPYGTLCLENSPSFSTQGNWGTALNLNGIKGTTWIGKLNSNGKNDDYHREDTGRDVIIFAPTTTDLSKKVEIIYYFHGIYGFTLSDMKDRVAKQAKEMSQAGRNIVIVFPELPWSKGTETVEGQCTGSEALSSNIRWCRSGGSSSIWNGIDSNLYELNNEVVTVIRDFPTASGILDYTVHFVGHSRGGAALLYSALYPSVINNYLSQIKPERITFSDSGYEWDGKIPYTEVFNNYVKSNPSAEMYLLVQGPINPSDSPTQNAVNFMKQIDTNFPGVNNYYQATGYQIYYVPLSKLHGEIGQMSLAWLPAVSVQQSVAASSAARGSGSAAPIAGSTSYPTSSSGCLSSLCIQIDDVWASISMTIGGEGAGKIWDGSRWVDKVVSSGSTFTLSTSTGNCLSLVISSTESEAESKLESVDFQGKIIRVNRIVAPLVKKINTEISSASISYPFNVVLGFDWRCVKSPIITINDLESCLGSSGSIQRSKHSYGTAIDINPSNNGFYVGSGPHDIPDQVIQIFKANGFRWGGDWDKAKDYMHFDWIGTMGDFNGDGQIENCPQSSAGANTITSNSITSYCGVATGNTPEIRALLDTVAWAEGGGYNIRFGGGTFSDLSTHPYFNEKENKVTPEPIAAGRYQFMYYTYDNLKNKKKVAFFNGFSAPEQDQAGAYLISGTGVSAAEVTSALNSGNFVPLWDKLAKIWAAIPYSGSACESSKYPGCGNGNSYYGEKQSEKTVSDLNAKLQSCYTVQKSK
mgnify:CR=1 FL=1